MKQIPNKFSFSRNHLQKRLFRSQNIPLKNAFFSTALRIKGSRLVTPKTLESFRIKLKKRLEKKRKRLNKKHKGLLRSRRNRFRKRSRKKAKLNFIIQKGFNQPLTKKPLQVRMGKGKGSTYLWAKPTQNLSTVCEISRRRLSLTKIHRCSSWTGFGKSLRFAFSRFFLRKQHKYRLKLERYVTPIYK